MKHFKKLFFLIISMSIFISATYDGGSYKIINDNNKNYNQSLKLNKFLFVSHIYEHCFYNLDLFNKISYTDRRDIINKLYLNLGSEYPVQLIIKNNNDSKDLLVSLRVQPTSKYKYKSVILATNYLMSEKRLIMNNENFDNSYATLYYIVKDRLVYHKFLENTSLIKEYLKKSEINNLANHYIYDDNFENDAQCESLLISSINSNDIQKTFINRLTLVQFYLLNTKFNKATEILNEAKTILIKFPNENWQEFYNLTKEEYEITKYLLDNYSN